MLQIKTDNLGKPMKKLEICCFKRFMCGGNFPVCFGTKSISPKRW